MGKKSDYLPASILICIETIPFVCMLVDTCTQNRHFVCALTGMCTQKSGFRIMGFVWN